MDTLHTTTTEDETASCLKADPGSSGHTLSPTDPDSPMNWSFAKKLYVSAVAFTFAFVVVYGTTTYTAAITAIPDAYGVSMRTALLGFTIPFFGVAFAPIYTPHLSERYGRRPVYLASLPLFSLCVVVISVAPNISTLLAFRFLAGLFGGPCLVLIEGTFADVWSAHKTVTYYSFLTVASYWGAAFGPIIGGFVFSAKGPAWLSWVTLFFATVAMAFGSAMPETYGREILRTRIRYNKSNIKLPCAQSGVTFSEMARITVLTPLKMLVTEPLVIMISLYLGLNFAVVFQWFISVPAALNAAYGFDTQKAGLAFLSAVGGTVLALVSSCLIEALASTQGKNGMGSIETRLIPAMFGSFLAAGSLFWIGFTADPKIHYLAPIFGTAVYVWGNAMVLISFISYLFDAYPPAGTLSALTSAACFRLVCAGIVPIFILDMLKDLNGKWTFSIFGIISAVMVLFPFILYRFGSTWRMKSAYSQAS
ncbi:major facilitator superfamily domain-containing protein [Thelonectria olida]|uniref:Major facilitator superfamily domain-containing protein n=1 Tax=Thelonectria olida TaxID=1576542 RepID=A0A9P9AIJ5_9HYPO|nr:major facilitator superfamily domain-containing protein [Thelonectria olida]